MASVEKAVEIAAKAHAGVLDKQGRPYLYHPLRVMLAVDDDDARIVAVLHDVVEDTDVTLGHLRAEGFSAAVMEALALVTHQDHDVSYSEYVIRAKRNRIARQVKIADLKDNTSLNRVLLRADKFESDARRITKYLLSYRFLTDQISEAEYRSLMAKFD